MNITAIEVVDPRGWELRPASPKREWMDAVPHGNAYRCLPLTMANHMGWVITCPTGFDVIWSGRWGSRGSLLFEFEDESYAHQISGHFGSGIVTFNVPWMFQTDVEGVGLWVTGAPNFYKTNIHPLTGFVETWWLPFTFTMNWKIDEPLRPVSFRKGDPICYLTPYDIRATQAMVVGKTTLAEAPRQLREKYQEWTRSRDGFNRDPRSREFAGQKHYLRGIDHSGGQASTHLTSLKLPSFYPEPSALVEVEGGSNGVPVADPNQDTAGRSDEPEAPSRPNLAG